MNKLIGNIIRKIENEYKEIFGNNLVGIYLHGSAAMGCFNAMKSDIDVIVVVKNEMDDESISQLAKSVVKFDDEHNPISIEMSVVLKKYIDEIEYPAPFLFHYSSCHAEKYRSDSKFRICNGEDPDLVSHFQMIKERGLCIYGMEIGELFKEIPKKYFIESIKLDQNMTIDDITKKPDYYVLNACRFLMYLKTGKFGSKTEGGEWALDNIKKEYQVIVKSALELYSGSVKLFTHNQSEVRVFKEFMDNEILLALQGK
jgi:streptomycin 3"-adenylyltransferase